MAIDNHDSAVHEIKPKNRTMSHENEEDGAKMWPPWLNPLLKQSFFARCKTHLDSTRSECNMYCLNCISQPICYLCLAHHKGHHVIQVRRSSYHDVIRVSEVPKVLDISGVQTYVINSARVVFLNERPQRNPGKGVTHACVVCERGLLDSFRFCSLGCKVYGKTNNSNVKTVHKKLHWQKLADAVALDDSEESLIHQSFSPSTSPTTSPTSPTTSTTINNSPVKRRRRKGIPHRAPLF